MTRERLYHMAWLAHTMPGCDGSPALSSRRLCSPSAALSCLLLLVNHRHCCTTSCAIAFLQTKMHSKQHGTQHSPPAWSNVTVQCCM